MHPNTRQLSVAALMLCGLACPAFAQGNGLEIGVQTSLFSSLLPPPSQTYQSSPIARSTADGTMVSGSADTGATSYIYPTDEAAGLGFGVTVQATTNTTLFGQNLAHRNIVVSFSGALVTATNAHKTFYLDAYGFHTRPTTVSSSTSGGIGEPQADASGLFWRLKERIALNQARDAVAAANRDLGDTTSAEVSRQVAEGVDRTMAQQLAPLNAKYFDLVHRPLLASGVLAALSFMSRNGVFYAMGDIPDAPPAAGWSINRPTDELPIRVAATGGFLGRLLGSVVKGRDVTGDELAQLLTGALGDDAQQIEIDADARAARFHVRAADAATVKISRAGLLTVGLSFDAIELQGGKSFQDVRVEVDAEVAKDGEEILLDLDKQIRVASADATAADKKAIARIIRQFVPPIQVSLSALHLFAGTFPVTIAAVDFADDQIRIGAASAGARREDAPAGASPGFTVGVCAGKATQDACISTFPFPGATTSCAWSLETCSNP